MKIKSFLCWVFVSMAISLPLVWAQETAIGKGIAWLEGNQSPNGSWSSNLTTPFEATCVVVIP